LLEEGFDVYQTLVDDQQIDCVVRGRRGKAPVYLDIQVKARSCEADRRSWGVWPSIKVTEPRENLFFVFYSEPLHKTSWVIPSQYLVAHSSRVLSGEYEGRFTVTLVTMSGDSERENPLFSRYKDSFKVLHDYIKRTSAT
ncbi:MAG: hypothetical protein LAO51_18540, partial [Acidobacteriia bacterium]|nr:hypothetical protein [Terriglobia bacterium]